MCSSPTSLCFPKVEWRSGALRNSCVNACVDGLSPRLERVVAKAATKGVVRNRLFYWATIGLRRYSRGGLPTSFLNRVLKWEGLWKPHNSEISATALASVPGEPFVEEQLRIKLASPAAFTFTAHMSSAYVGYIPTVQAFAHGGYETRTSIGSKLAPEALGMIGDTVIGMLNDAFPTRRGQA